MDPWLISKLANLEYDPTAQLVETSETDVKAILKLPINFTEMALSSTIYGLLSTDAQQIRSNRTNKVVPIGANRYTLHLGDVSVFGAKVAKSSNAVANLEALLSTGWVVKQLDTVILSTDDVGHLVMEPCFNEALMGIIIVCVNDHIASNCNWRHGGQYGVDINTYVEDTRVTTGKNDGVFEESLEMPASQYVMAHVTRAIEHHLDTVFEFIQNDRDAFYNASWNGIELIVNKYADARAIIWAIGEKRRAWITSDIDNSDEHVPLEKERREQDRRR